MVWTLSKEERNQPSRSKKEEEHVLPTVSIDYFFMGPSEQDEAQGVLPMSAVKSHESRMTFAHVVVWKGFVDSATRRLAAALNWLGLRRPVFNQIRSQRFSLSNMLFENQCPQWNL